LGVPYCKILLTFDQKFANYAWKITQSITKEFVRSGTSGDHQPTRTIGTAYPSDQTSQIHVVGWCNFARAKLWSN